MVKIAGDDSSKVSIWYFAYKKGAAKCRAWKF
jgi:hypothetical protein